MCFLFQYKKEISVNAFRVNQYLCLDMTPEKNESKIFSFNSFIFIEWDYKYFASVHTIKVQFEQKLYIDPDPFSSLSFSFRTERHLFCSRFSLFSNRKGGHIELTD